MIACASAIFLAVNAGAAPAQDAATFLAQGDPRAARDLLTAAIRAAPTDGALHLQQARAALALGDGVTAQAEVEAARRYGVADPASRAALAEALVLQRRPDDALAELADGPIATAQLGAAFRIRGEALALAGDDAGAKLAFDRALLAAPHDARVWTDLGRFRATQGDNGGARIAADRALLYGPRDVVALTLRGDLARDQYGLAAGIAWYDRALLVDPRNVAVLVSRAAAAGEMGHTRQLLADTRAALALDPRNATAWYLQAALAARAGNFALAQRLMQRTNGDLDDMPGAMLLDGAIALRTGNIEQAISRLARLVGDQPENRAARRLLAAAEWQSGDAYAVETTLRPLADGGDGDGWTLLLLGRALERQGERAEAAAYLDRAALVRPAPPPATGAAELDTLRDTARENPGDALARIALIRGLVRGGLFDEALAEATDLRAHNPGVADAHALVGDAYAATEHWAEAATAYRAAAAIAFTEPTALRLIDALRRAGDGVGAQRVLAIYRAQNPRSVPARLLSVDLLMRAGDWAPLTPLLEGLRRELGDRNAALLANLSWAYAHSGRRREALALGARAWGLMPASPGLAHSYGWLLYNTRVDRSRALALLEQAAAQVPEDASMKRHLAEAINGVPAA